MQKYVPVGDDIQWIYRKSGLAPETLFKNSDVFNHEKNHHFSSSETLAHFSRSAGIGLLRAIVLCLKGSWGYHFACEVNKSVTEKNADGTSAISSPAERKRKALKRKSDSFHAFVCGKRFSTYGIEIRNRDTLISSFSGTAAKPAL